MAKNLLIEFYHVIKEEIEVWIEKLSDRVVLIDLKEDFSIHALIGKGNFARVHLCKKKSNDKTFALKSIEKSLIKKS